MANIINHLPGCKKLSFDTCQLIAFRAITNVCHPDHHYHPATISDFINKVTEALLEEVPLFIKPKAGLDQIIRQRMQKRFNNQHFLKKGI